MKLRITHYYASQPLLANKPLASR